MFQFSFLSSSSLAFIPSLSLFFLSYPSLSSFPEHLIIFSVTLSFKLHKDMLPPGIYCIDLLYVLSILKSGRVRGQKKRK